MINWVPKKSINNERVQELLEKSITTNTFTNNGPNVQYLESLIREKLCVDSTKAVVCVDNGTSALHAIVGCISMKLGRKLQWATQSLTFPASAQGFLQDVMIIDIDTDGGIDLNSIDLVIVDGIIVTNIFGNTVDIQKYLDWAAINDKLVVFDNAATSFTFYNGKNSVNYGVASSISFHHTKPIGFGEGGAIIIDKQYEHELRKCINFGIDNVLCTPWHRLGSNYKMSEIAAIYIIQYFERIADIVQHHSKLYTHLKSVLPQDIQLFPNFSDGIPFVACFCLLSQKFTPDFLTKILQSGIYCRKYYNPLIRSPIACNMYNQILCLPCTIDMTIDDINRICQILI